MTEPYTQDNTAILDDDPSVAAYDPAGSSTALVGPRHVWKLDEGLRLESGVQLAPLEVAYETWGTLNPQGTNAVLVCHALTGDSHAAGKHAAEDTRLGWWDPLIGPGRALDTGKLFVICANVLGGCQGTTGPASTNPATGQPYGSAFPQVTVRDIVRLQYRLLKSLGVRRMAAVIGGSLGGMQVLEWLVMHPEMVDAAIPIGASLAHTAQGIAYNLVGREAIMLDPAWQEGNYYGTGRAPGRGLALARMVGIITYQSEESMRRKFHRARADNGDGQYYRPESHFQVENYLHYQGASLVQRFDANSYLVLSRAMDLHDVGRGRRGADAALSTLSHKVRTLVIGISSDILFPTHLQRETAGLLASHGFPASYCELTSPWGHDAFLIEYGQLTAAISQFLGATGG